MILMLFSEEKKSDGYKYSIETALCFEAQPAHEPDQNNGTMAISPAPLGPGRPKPMAS